MSVGAICGGSQANIVPDRCTILIDRRTLPGETEAGVRREIIGVLRRKQSDRDLRGRQAAALSAAGNGPQAPAGRPFPEEPSASASRSACATSATRRCSGMAASPAWCSARGTLRRRTRRMNGFHSLRWSAAKGCCCVSCNRFLEPERPWPPPNSMLAEKVEPPPVTAAAHRASFFRQSGWLMFATVGGRGVHDGGAFAVPRHAERGVWAVCGVPFGRHVHPGHAAANGAGPTDRPGARAAPGTRAVRADPGRVAGDVPGVAGGGRRGAAVPEHDHGAVEDYQPRRDLADAAGAAVHRLAADVLRGAARAAELPLDGLEHDAPRGGPGGASPPSRSSCCITTPRAWCWVFWAA